MRVQDEPIDPFNGDPTDPTINPLYADMKRDGDALIAGLREEGFLKDRIRIDPQLLMDYLGPFVEPTQVERFRFSREWMREQFQRINNPKDPAYTVSIKLNLPPSYLLIHRVWLGGLGVLSQLDCEAPFRAELDRWRRVVVDPPRVGLTVNQGLFGHGSCVILRR